MVDALVLLMNLIAQTYYTIRGRTNFVTKTLCILTNVKIFRNAILSAYFSWLPYVGIYI